ncbi:tyrosine-protein kinase Shark-like [Condylostylus longicornis]|uniref:tyrosine-protein kinase Shark-like n=1 Tax=Condylostylus longicornis TaxID=2530218 RepID=UPI00244DFAA2|nr:tyrosine-protein kinase Shark-like [Condylostylus longicornis]XP_055378513.1 tyrosine-protein kinase Shark-like [Condylostylus longicornis]XP_055378523.1 tyrosine-protein kinase Shark-like [Condylostylus longicornis]
MIKYYNEKSNWYHNISLQEEAEKLLKSDDSENGSFLIMPNSLQNGDLILSVLYENEVSHYQIHKNQNNEDPFYSINGAKIFHGVDTIVDYYSDSKNITKNAIITHLREPIKGELPPKDILCHGRTNLLHKAIVENDEKRILELLKEEERNINARDQDDLTAVHLACLYECNEKIFKCILKAGAKIECKDASGNTPLHYACRTKSSGFIKALIDSNVNTIHMRNPETGCVPLHDAAKFGNMKAIQMLLKAGATTMPRTKLVQFPLDLAIEAGHFEIAEYLKRYSVEPAKTKRIHWYHGTLDRQEANKLVQEYENNLREKLMKKKKIKKSDKNQIYANIESINEENEKENLAESLHSTNNDDPLKYSTEGVFLIRQSARSGYALSLWSDNQVKHFIISESIQHFYLDEGPYFLSLEHLVQHYSAFSDGLPVNLRFPVPPKTKPPLPAFSTMPKSEKKRSQTKSLNVETLPELPEKTSSKTPLRYFSHPGDDALKRVGGLFERSPTPSSSSGNSSNNQIDCELGEDKNDSEKNSPRDNSIFASLRFSKTSPKKNFIIDGMRSLRKSKNKSPLKFSLSEDKPSCKPRSIFHDVDDLIRQQQLNDPEFNIRSAKDLMKNLCFQVSFVDPIYKVPTNNRAITSVDNVECVNDICEKVNIDDNTTLYESVEEIKSVEDGDKYIDDTDCDHEGDKITDKENNENGSIKDNSAVLSCELLFNNRYDIEVVSSNIKNEPVGLNRNSLESTDSNSSFDIKSDTNSVIVASEKNDFNNITTNN